MERALNLGLAASALISAITFSVHTFVGGIYVARPLLASKTLPPASKWLNYFTWHMATIYLAVQTGVFAGAAGGYIHRDAVVFALVLAASFSILCIGVALRAGIRPWRFPASYLFALTVLAGGWGLCF